MAENSSYDKARELAEEALTKTVEGDNKAAEKLAQKAKATNEQAVEDVLQDLDEDADSEHDVEKLNGHLGNEAVKQ